MLVCSVAISQLRVLSFERSHRMSEQSTAQFCFPLMSWTHVSGWPHNKHHHKRSVTHQFYTCQPCSCGADRQPLPVLLLKSDIYCFTNLSQTLLGSNTVRLSVVFIFLESIETVALGLWQVCDWLLPRSVLWLLPLIGHIVFCMFCVVCLGESLLWGSWDNSR